MRILIAVHAVRFKLRTSLYLGENQRKCYTVPIPSRGKNIEQSRHHSSFEHLYYNTVIVGA